MTVSPILEQSVEIAAWLVAAVWAFKSAEVVRNLPSVPDLLLLPQKLRRETPSLTVIVPARNEQAHVAACVESLLAQDYPNLQILAVDDRSTDQTGAILASLATAHPDRLHVLTITELPPYWLGKTHAMAKAAAQSSTDYFLFTDADVLFRADAIRRSLAYAVASRADHLVTVPTTLIKRWDEAAFLSFFQIFGLWASRPWRVADPKSKRDALGIGAFNLIRRTAYLDIGGFESLRMEIVEDVGLGRRVKRAGLAQRVAFGRGLASVHWASGAAGLINVMTKNLWAAFRFYIWLALLGCLWLIVFCVAPGAGLFYAPTRIPAILTLAAVAYGYNLMGRASGLSTWNALLFPLSALAFVFTLLRSMILTLKQGGVIWRGTFYSLAELRKNAAPI